MAGFPDFTSALENMHKAQSSTLQDTSYQYQVSIAMNGELIILESLKKKFEQSHMFAGEFARIVSKHNSEFNKSNRTADDAAVAPGEKNQNIPAGCLKLEKQFDTVEAFKAEHKELLDVASAHEVWFCKLVVLSSCTCWLRLRVTS